MSSQRSPTESGDRMDVMTEVEIIRDTDLTRSIYRRIIALGGLDL